MDIIIKGCWLQGLLISVGFVLFFTLFVWIFNDFYWALGMSIFGIIVCAVEARKF